MFDSFGSLLSALIRAFSACFVRKPSFSWSVCFFMSGMKMCKHKNCEEFVGREHVNRGNRKKSIFDQLRLSINAHSSINILHFSAVEFLLFSLHFF